MSEQVTPITAYLFLVKSFHRLWHDWSLAWPIMQRLYILVNSAVGPSRWFKPCSRRHNSSINGLTVLWSCGLDSQTLLNSN